MGRLRELANQLTGVKVPPVPSLKNHMEPLPPPPLLAVPSVPPVPCKKRKVENRAQKSCLQKGGRPRLTAVGLQVEPSEQLRVSAHPETDEAIATGLLPDDQPQHIIQTAAIASPEWIASRDQYHNHLWGCRACHAPVGRYCATGADLRQLYNQTTMEPAQ